MAGIPLEFGVRKIKGHGLKIIADFSDGKTLDSALSTSPRIFVACAEA
ncbi:hypothetical protein Gbfr_022_124 [Gluconobacter frateurii M-2]|nr:hypothetical protein Gbfr_022_124 [Gluconobacter frateurii M-2]